VRGTGCEHSVAVIQQMYFAVWMAPLCQTGTARCTFSVAL
jgi:hypothetical protein